MARTRSLNVKIRPHGTGFQARPSVNGKQISIVRPTVKEVEAELAKLYLNKTPQGGSTITLGEFITSWCEREKSRAASGRRSANTWRIRTAVLSKHVIPVIGHVRMSALTRDLIRGWSEQGENRVRSAQNPLGAGVGTRAFQAAFAALSAALSEAVDDGLLDSNPCLKTGKRSLKPHHRKQDIEILEWRQVEALLDAALEPGTFAPFVYSLVLLAATTGMRQGELFALRVADFDWEARTVNVHRHVVKDTESELVAQAGTKGTKAEIVKKRLLKLSKATADALATWCDSLGPEELVFPNTRGGYLDRSNFMDYHFRPLLDAAGVDRVTFHSLRHTHASVLISAGVNIRTIADRLGHSKIQITLDTYGHLMPGDQEKCADVMDTMQATRRNEHRAVDENSSKIAWPSVQVLLELANEHRSMRSLGAHLGVSDNAIRKHVSKTAGEDALLDLCNRLSRRAITSVG